MAYLNWLHLSDWHQQGPEFDRTVITDELIADIRSRSADIDAGLANIDFIVFSGDIANSGEERQFALATEKLIDPIRESIGKQVPIYIVPGNHDIQRPLIPSIPPHIGSTLASENSQEIENLLQKNLIIGQLNEPFANFYDFASKQGCKYDFNNKLYFVGALKKGDQQIGIACLNTAWHSARFKVQPRPKDKEQEFWDRGVLRTTEAQISNALRDLGAAHIKIVIMHHPLHWLDEVDQAKAEQMIARNCHIVLHGHEHRPNMNRLSNAFGDVVTIPAGASYNRRVASDPRCTNAYNFCSVDLETNAGTIFHRVWSEVHGEWQPDERFWEKGKSTFFIQKKQAFEQQKMARKSLNHLSKKYLEYVYKRPVKSQDIIMTHKAERIDGELFIRATVRFTIELHPGDAERFPVRSLVNPRIVSHPNPKVREAFHTLNTFTPNPSELKWSEDKTQCEAHLDLGPNDRLVEYEFEMLETTDGLYYFNLRKFTDKVKFTLYKDPELEYEDLSFGGFPAKKRGHDKMLKADVWETTELSMPNQGLLVQWYPKPKATAPKPVAASGEVSAHHGGENSPA